MTSQLHRGVTGVIATSRQLSFQRTLVALRPCARGVIAVIRIIGARGALDGKLVELKTYRKALQHVALTCGERKGRYRAIIKSIALAKGLPKRSRQQHIHAFFA
jgi:hypothetical protein